MSAKSLEFIQRATNWSDWKVSCVESVYVPHWASLWSSLVILGKKSENMNISDVTALTDQWLNECKINKRRGSRTYGTARGWRRPRPSGWGTRKPRRTARWCASLLFVWFSSSPDASSGAIYPTELPPTLTASSIDVTQSPAGCARRRTFGLTRPWRQTGVIKTNSSGLPAARWRFSLSHGGAGDTAPVGH